ncbi:disease resistance-like protein DSC2 [Gastrolobium bilobum]|uniref:disease resistance-like protein DSC2 n=1 Tax=Gastrolobium bilobum TaxID=150636 RepID=UPI002AB26981|nr:disease resistance-like protein DSC2 [Gastrolobium bilobum]
MAVMKLPPAHWSYDVFVSFSRKDTHQSFMNNLDYVLRRRGIMTFMDDGEFKSGHSISHSDSKEALEESRISIVVLSPDYAYSTWCLNKLVEILDCRKRKNQLVWPIFYNVEPTDVRHQKNSYRKAMAAHKNRFREDFEKVQKWRSALSEVANLEGWQEGIKIIERIVEFAVEFLFIDVFLSFSGEDTRYSFTGFLYYALRQEEFKTFMDDEGLKGGDEISETLIKTIKQSRLSIIIFSENYAYSSWCLDELVKIIECKNLNKQLVLPIFYKVEKSDVCNQEKSYGDAMAEHGNIYGNDSEKVQKWRSALSDVANLEGGEHIKENESEYEFIKKIVGIVRARLSTGKDSST